MNNRLAFRGTASFSNWDQNSSLAWEGEVFVPSGFLYMFCFSEVRIVFYYYDRDTPRLYRVGLGAFRDCLRGLYTTTSGAFPQKPGFAREINATLRGAQMEKAFVTSKVRPTRLECDERTSRKSKRKFHRITKRSLRGPDLHVQSFSVTI